MSEAASETRTRSESHGLRLENESSNLARIDMGGTVEREHAVVHEDQYVCPVSTLR